MWSNSSREGRYYLSCVIRSQYKPSLFLSRSSFSYDPHAGLSLQHVVLDLWIMIYYPIKSTSPPWLSEREKEKIKCELLLWLFPLMSTLFLFLLSNPTLGSREPPSSRKNPTTQLHAPWPPLADPPEPCSRGLMQTWLGFILRELNAAFILIGYCRGVFY